MRRIPVIVVGKLKQSPLRELSKQYEKRLKHYAKVDLIELKDSDPVSEGDKMLKHASRWQLPVIALSEDGSLESSAEFSRRIERADHGMVFFVGGPYGLSEAAKAGADTTLSLSPMTFTHEFARVLLLEQLYRAFTIIDGTGYHH